MEIWIPPADVHVTYSRQYRRCRKGACSVCRASGPGHGPYWFAYWREQGKLHSRYLGKTLPTTAGKATVQDNPPAPSPALRVRTMGGLMVWRENNPLPGTAWRRRKALTLFALLLSSPECILPRDRALDILWPDLEPAAATRNLHATIHALRTLLDLPDPEESLLRLQGDTLALGVGGAPIEAWLDAAAFAGSARSALAGGSREACRAALALNTGDFLPEIPYLDQVMARREELRDWRLALLTRLANLAANAGDYEEAEQCRRAVLAIDPCHEDAAGALMASLAARGHRSDALRVYQELAAALEDELGLVPGDEVEALRAGLQKIDAAVRAEAPTPIHGGHLPVPLTSFVGRTWEVDELSSLLTRLPDSGGRRLLTLTGAGGCGKTRLALAIAARLIDHAAYLDGVWLIELAAIGAGPPVSPVGPADPTPVEQALLTALGLREETGKRLGALRDFLSPRKALILLDNCEHLAGACSAIAADLLGHCPDLRILATSRAPLGMAGETVWHLSPLATPPLGENLAVEDLSRYEATRLFLDRALAAQPTLSLGGEPAQLIGRICHRLDGLPLAIELAAARLTALTPALLAERLDDCLGLLRGGNRAALPRQQTLESTMEWSYALLAPEARLLLQRLAVFSGGWTRAAAEAVCADPALLSPGESSVLPGERVADLLAELVSWSLVVRNDGPEEPRYGFLETVRQYAYARLAGTGEERLLRERHGAYYLAEAERAGKGLLTPERDRWMDLLVAHQDNLRAALAWSVSQAGNGIITLSLAGALAPFWLWRGRLGEGTHWLSRALALGGNGPLALRAAALKALGTMLNEQGESKEALVHYRQSEAIYRALGDDTGTASTLINQGNAAKYLGDFTQARSLYEQGSEILRRIGDMQTQSIVLNNLGALCIDLDLPREAAVYLEECLVLRRALRNDKGIVRTLGNLAEVSRMLGDYTRAWALYDEYLPLAERLGDTAGMAIAWYNLGLIARAKGEKDRAVTLFRDSLALERELGNKRHLAHTLEALAGLAADGGYGERAAHLFGFAGALRTAIRAPMPPANRALYKADIAVTRSLLPQDSPAWQIGEALSLEAAIAEALAPESPEALG